MAAKTFAAQANGDEADENFRVQIGNASGATIADGVGMDTITDDD
jgi:hypothetical protein